MSVSRPLDESVRWAHVHAAGVQLAHILACAGMVNVSIVCRTHSAASQDISSSPSARNVPLAHRIDAESVLSRRRPVGMCTQHTAGQGALGRSVVELG